MGSNYVDHLIDDDEVPELTDEDFKNSLTFEQLPESEQHILREIQRGNVVVRPDPVKKTVQLTLSSDVLEKFEAKGEGWQSKVDEALREWLEEHKAS
jgi:uncharacterized protein (DUF4415 family)